MRLWTVSSGWKILTITWQNVQPICKRFVREPGVKFQPGHPGWNSSYKQPLNLVNYRLAGFTFSNSMPQIIKIKEMVYYCLTPSSVLQTQYSLGFDWSPKRYVLCVRGVFTYNMDFEFDFEFDFDFEFEFEREKLNCHLMSSLFLLGWGRGLQWISIIFSQRNGR